MTRASADPEPVPGTRAGDLALAALVLLLGAQELVSLFSGDPLVRGVLADPAVAVVVGSVLAAAQAATMLLRRPRPRGAYLLMAALMAAQLTLVGAFGVFGWGFLAFAVARSPGRAAGWLVLPLPVALAIPALVRSRGLPTSQEIGRRSFGPRPSGRLPSRISSRTTFSSNAWKADFTLACVGSSVGSAGQSSAMAFF